MDTEYQNKHQSGRRIGIITILRGSHYVHYFQGYSLFSVVFTIFSGLHYFQGYSLFSGVVTIFRGSHYFQG